MLFHQNDQVAGCIKQSPEEIIALLTNLNISPVCSTKETESLGGGLTNPQTILVTSFVFLLTFLGQTYMASKTQRMLEKIETDTLIEGLNVFTLGQLNQDQIKEKLSYILGDSDFTMEDTEIVQKLTIACAKGNQFQPNLLALTNYMTSNMLCDTSAKITSIKNTTAFSVGSMLVSGTTIAFMLCILLYYFTGNETYKKHANSLKAGPSKKGGKQTKRKMGKKSRQRKNKRPHGTKKRRV